MLTILSRSLIAKSRVFTGLSQPVGGFGVTELFLTFHSSSSQLKDKSTLVRSSTGTGPRKSKFATEDYVPVKKERSEEQKAKLQQKREERAQKKKEIRKTQIDRNKQKEAKLAEKKAALSTKKPKKKEEEFFEDEDE